MNARDAALLRATLASEAARVEMVNRVARAISRNMWTTVTRYKNDDDDWREMPAYVRAIYRNAARAAINALAPVQS